jgi:hypothetical protein
VVILRFAILITARDPFTDYKKFAIGWVLKFAALYLLVTEGLLTDWNVSRRPTRLLCGPC